MLSHTIQGVHFPKDRDKLMVLSVQCNPTVSPLFHHLLFCRTQAGAAEGIISPSALLISDATFHVLKVDAAEWRIRILGSECTL